MSTVHLTTAEQLLEMPGDGFRYELVHGELRRMAPAGYEHGFIGGDIIASLSHHVRSRNLGRVCLSETGFLLERDPDHVLCADVAFISKARHRTKSRTRGFFPGPPDLAIEIVSPSDRYEAVEEKVQDWLSHGTRMVIVVNPRLKQAKVYLPDEPIQVLKRSDSIDGGKVVPGWHLKLADIFE